MESTPDAVINLIFMDIVNRVFAVEAFFYIYENSNNSSGKCIGVPTHHTPFNITH
tara:strand:+ start:109 stop:273 length:165 start_codon:yes stop_codon:yes gene_type:complete